MNIRVNAELFKNIIGVIKEITEDVEFYFLYDSFQIQAMDASHVCMIDLYLIKDFFEEYQLNNSCTIGVNLTDLQNILKMASKNDILQLNNDNNSDILNITINSNKKKVNFNLKLQDIEQDRIMPQEILYTHTIIMNSNEFEKTIKDILNIGKGDEKISCYIRTGTNQTIEFDFEGNSGTGTLIIEDCEVDLQLETEVKLKINPNYLIKFAKCSKLTDTITIKLMNGGVPFCCQYDLMPNNNNTGSYLRFYLAQQTTEEQTTEE